MYQCYSIEFQQTMSVRNMCQRNTRNYIVLLFFTSITQTCLYLQAIIILWMYACICNTQRTYGNQYDCSFTCVLWHLAVVIYADFAGGNGIYKLNLAPLRWTNGFGMSDTQTVTVALWWWSRWILHNLTAVVIMIRGFLHLNDLESQLYPCLTWVPASVLGNKGDRRDIYHIVSSAIGLKNNESISKYPESFIVWKFVLYFI